MKTLILLSAALSFGLSGIASADEVINDDLIVIDDLLCVGTACADGETPLQSRQGIKIKDINPGILFEDVSSSNYPHRNWSIRINQDTPGGQDQFAIFDEGAGTAPFRILGDTEHNIIVLAPNGRVGINTMLPTEELHIVSTGFTSLRMDADLAFWDMIASIDSFGFRDANSGYEPFRIKDAAPSWSLVVSETGDIGLGTQTPAGPLEISDEQTFTFFRITAENAAINQSADIVFTEGPLGTGQLRYNIVDGDSQEMSLDAEGNMVLSGALTTGGPTCAGGCDAVFDADFARLSINDHAALMWGKGHLPAVGPTLPGQPVNVTEKMGRMLNELEHAHIYIEQQHRQIAEMKAEHARQIEALTARLDALVQGLDAQ